MVTGADGIEFEGFPGRYNMLRKYQFLYTVFFALSLIIVPLVFAQTKGGGFSAPAVEGQWYDKSVALVVGISKYSNGWSSLTEPRNDAKRVADALKAQGFEVITLTDGQATKTAILQQIQTYIPAKVGKKGRFVFYYSGHGQTQVAARTGKQLGYIVPADGRKLAQTDDWASYISMSNLRAQINNTIPAKHVLIVFDSCFSGTALTKSGAMSGNVSHFLTQPAINVLTAGDAGQPTPDGAFSYDFVNAINGSADGVGGQQDGYVTFAEVGTYLQSQIPAKVAGLSPSFGWWDGTSQMVFQQGEVSEKVGVTQYTNSIKGTDYDAIIAQAIEREKENKVKEERMGHDYKKVLDILNNTQISKQAKNGVCDKFLSDYPNRNEYTDYIRSQCLTYKYNLVKSVDGFWETSCGSIIDTNSHLEWFVGPDVKTSGKAAFPWAENLDQCDGGWRMPTINELRTLYRKGKGVNNLHPIFKTSGWSIWSSEINRNPPKPAKVVWVWFFDFKKGKAVDFFPNAYEDSRAFAVRKWNK